MSNSLEERLKTHSNAFDGLLSLIPAKYYYDESTQDQWQQKKKSKDELKQNKRDKLDPSKNLSSAEDVMKERAKTAQPVQLPKKFERPVEVDEDEDEDDDEEEVEIPDMDVDDDSDDSEEEQEQTKTEKPVAKEVPSKVNKEESQDDDEDSIQIEFDDEGNEINETNEQNSEVSEKPSKPLKKQLSEEEIKQKEERLKRIREKLSSKINNLREKRKAPGTKNGGPVKSREQMLAYREELKKQAKKRKHDEVEESDSESESESENEEEKEQVYFGNITFNDGTRVTSDLTSSRNTAERKKKGPANNDIKAHLLKLEKKKAKLAQLTPEEQTKLLEKDKWQKLMNQAEGIKVKDDEKLLKKALKRKEKKKLKSELEWRDRKQIVKDTISAKIKRRDENLKQRKANKGKKRKDQVRLKKFTGIVNNTKSNPKNKKKRAGFEGSAKSKKK
ncbi:ribosomal RNA-processing protein 14 [[Candida] jaroonii]|uniref:Ribosomal RNA-processing protein 14 n=1 Tax=[Candida] jaroonii TaxID=467808 RepID=A0ACA9YDA8_9ASCO|nr:ribosomal RNA-processing protein 14 [[Candida] jaroonii]